MINPDERCLEVLQFGVRGKGIQMGQEFPENAKRQISIAPPSLQFHPSLAWPSDKQR